MQEESQGGFWSKVNDFFFPPPPITRSEPITSSDLIPSPILPPPPRRGGLPVNERTALTIPGFARCVAIITDALSQLPVKAFKQGAEVDSPIVNKPHNILTLPEYISAAAFALVMYGEVFILKVPYLSMPGIQTTELLNNELVTVVPHKGRRVFHYADEKYTDDQVIHVMVRPRHDVMSSVFRGSGIVADNRESLQSMLDLNRYIGEWWDRNAIVPVFLKTTQNLSPEASTALQNSYVNRVDRERGPVILHSGLDITTDKLNPEQAQFVAIAQKHVADVARMLGIPGSMVDAQQAGSSLTYSNVQDNDRRFMKETLMTYVTALETALTAIAPNGTTVKFNLDAYLRPNTKERMETYKVGKEVGAYTTDEIRELEDRPALQEGESNEAA